MKAIKVGELEVRQPAGLWWYVCFGRVPLTIGMRKGEAMQEAKKLSKLIPKF